MRHTTDVADVHLIVSKAIKAERERLADALQVEHNRIMASIPNASNPMVVEAVQAGAGTLAVIIAALRKVTP